MSLLRKVALASMVCVLAGAVVVAAGADAQQSGGGAGGQQTQPAASADNVAIILEQVKGTAEKLKKSLDELPDLIEKAKRSEENARALLTSLEALVKEVSERVAEDSQLWIQLKELQEQWLEEQRRAEQKAAANAQWAEIAQMWGDKVQRVEELKKEIVARRGESLALLDDLMDRKDVVIEYVKLGMAELVVQELENISNQFGEMNEGLSRMVAIASQLGAQEQ
jgi:DNA repair exonuclease SbcCD ATPase subunit